MNQSQQKMINNFIGKKRKDPLNYEDISHFNFNYGEQNNTKNYFNYEYFDNNFLSDIQEEDIKSLNDYNNSSSTDNNPFNTDFDSVISSEKIDNLEMNAILFEEKKNIEEFELSPKLKEEMKNTIKEINNQKEKTKNNTEESSQETGINIELKEIKNEKKISPPLFKTIYPKKITLFTYSNTDFIQGFELNNKNAKKRIRFTKSNKRNRGDYDDDTRRMIKRNFFNRALIKEINILLRKGGSKYFFAKFHQKFVSDIVKNNNKDIINMTLKQIFEKKNIIGDNYFHNIKVIEALKNIKNIELEKILNTKFCDLFNEYINSNEFKIDEINRLKQKNKSNDFIERYIYLSKHFIEFYSE